MIELAGLLLSLFGRDKKACCPALGVLAKVRSQPIDGGVLEKVLLWVRGDVLKLLVLGLHQGALDLLE